MRLRADRSACRGAGQCVFTAPALFDQDETEGLVLLLVPHPEGAELQDARRAIVACPNRALSEEP
ncbi:MAG: ferredoxin [Streptosporangiaceae bacterium]